MADELAGELESLKLDTIYWVDDDNVLAADMDVDKLLSEVSRSIGGRGSKSIKNAIGKVPSAWRPELKKLQSALEGDEANAVEERPDRTNQIETTLQDLANNHSTDAKTDLNSLLESLDGKLSKEEKKALESLFKPLAKKIGYAWRPLSFSEWEKEQNAIFQVHTASKPALILLDQQNTRDQSVLDGNEILRRVCGNDKHRAAFKFLIVTNTCTPDQEFEHAADLASTINLGKLGIQSPFFTMSKSWISRTRKQGDKSADDETLKEHFVSLFRRLRLSLLNQELTSLAKGVIQEATNRAFNRLTEITLHEFMYAVTQSSQLEGVSELDTLLRLIAIEQRDALLDHVVKSAKLRQALENIRGIPINIRVKELSTRTDLAKLRGREVYWPAEAVNRLHQPIAAGDIFETKRENDTDYYILLGNDCDLMLRSEGERNSVVVLLAKLEAKNGGNKDLDAILEYPLPQDVRLGRVPLNRFVSVTTDVLDLCWNNTKGACIWDPSKDYDALHLLRTQRARLALLRLRFGKQSSLERIAASSPIPLARKAKVGAKVNFRLRRVGRMNTQYAQGILAKFASVFARPSYDHDYTEVREHPISKVSKHEQEIVDKPPRLDRGKKLAVKSKKVKQTVPRT